MFICKCVFVPVILILLEYEISFDRLISFIMKRRNEQIMNDEFDIIDLNEYETNKLKVVWIFF